MHKPGLVRLLVTRSNFYVIHIDVKTFMAVGFCFYIRFDILNCFSNYIIEFLKELVYLNFML